jgi:D-3-phosphoglycerate dehydrogenase / 2-oxoglutarate reductase
MKVLVTCPRVDISRVSFDTFFNKKNIDADYIFPENQGFDSKEMIQIYDEYEMVIVGDDEINEDFLSKVPLLKNIIKWGKGTDNIDKVACKKENISVYNSPGNIAKFVAEHGLSLINTLNKNIIINMSSVNQNKWFKNSSHSLFDKTVGFYGFGAIAREFVELLKPFGVKVIYYDIQLLENDFKQVSIDELFENSNVLIVSSELTDENYGEIDKKLLTKMNNDSILINISRGQIINEADLISCLEDNSIRGAGLDVFTTEPLTSTNGLLKLDNVVLTCHNASNTEQASIEVNEEIIQIMESLI